MWGQIAQRPTCTTGSPRLDSNPEPGALRTMPTPPKALRPPKASPSQEKHLFCPSLGFLLQGLADRRTAEAEGQAVHPPAWPGVRSLSPDRPHRLLPPCRGLIQARAASEQFCLAAGKVGMVWNARCLGGWSCCLCNCPASLTSGTTDGPAVLRTLSPYCRSLPGALIMFILITSSPNMLANQSSPWSWERGGGSSSFYQASISVGGLIFYCHIRGTRKENIIKLALPGVGNPYLGRRDVV